MKITCTESFSWVHKGIFPKDGEDTREIYELGSEPIEITQEAYDHLISVFGKEMFTIVDESFPKESSESSSEEPIKKKAGRPKKDAS